MFEDCAVLDLIDDDDDVPVVGFIVDVDVDSDSFSGDDGGSLDPASFVTGLYGGIVLTLPPFF